MLIYGGAKVNFRTEDGISPLSLAVQYDCFSQARLLVKNGAQIYFKAIEARDNSPIFMAVKI